MNRLLLYTLLTFACVFAAMGKGVSPLSIRLDYMLKQIDKPSVDPNERMAWADSVIAHSSQFDNKNLLAEVLIKKGNIAFQHAFYKKALTAYLDWISLYGKQADTATLISVYDHTAELYYYMGWYHQAINLSIDIIKHDKEAELRYYDIISNQRIAHCYIRLHNTTLANRYISEADNLLHGNSIKNKEIEEKVNFDMNILRAGISIMEGNYEKTNRYIIEARKYAHSPKDSIAVLGDEAILYELIGDPGISRKCYENIVEMKNVSYTSLVTINNYIHFLTSRGEYDMAYKICALSHDMLATMELDHSKSNLMELESNIFMKKGDYRKAHQLLLESKKISDSIFSPDNLSSIYRTSNISEIYNLKKDLEETSNQSQNRKTIIYSLSGVSIIVTIILVIFLRSIYRKHKAAVDRINQLSASCRTDSDKIEELQADIDRRERELESYLSSLSELGETIGKIKEISTSKAQTNSELNKISQLVDNLNPIYDHWDNDRINFDRILGKLAAHIPEKHPSVTKAEITMAAFIVLNIPSKRIADMQHLSVRTVENTKYRLYKKLGIPAPDVPEYLRSLI